MTRTVKGVNADAVLRLEDMPNALENLFELSGRRLCCVCTPSSFVSEIRFEEINLAREIMEREEQFCDLFDYYY